MVKNYERAYQFLQIARQCRADGLFNTTHDFLRMASREVGGNSYALRLSLLYYNKAAEKYGWPKKPV